MISIVTQRIIENFDIYPDVIVFLREGDLTYSRLNEKQRELISHKIIAQEMFAFLLFKSHFV